MPFDARRVASWTPANRISSSCGATRSPSGSRRPPRRRALRQRSRRGHLPDAPDDRRRARRLAADTPASRTWSGTAPTSALASTSSPLRDHPPRRALVRGDSRAPAERPVAALAPAPARAARRTSGRSRSCRSEAPGALAPGASLTPLPPQDRPPEWPDREAVTSGAVRRRDERAVKERGKRQDVAAGTGTLSWFTTRASQRGSAGP